MQSASKMKYAVLMRKVLKDSLVRRSLSSSQKSHNKQIGFIGLGNMGNYMAENLLKKGNPILVHDIYPEGMANLQDQGASVAQSPAEVAEKCNTIVTMLPSSPNVIEVCNGENGIFQTIKSGTILIDSSTIEPNVSKDMASIAETKNAFYMDAPVSGGVNAAKAGTLTFMVGGQESKYETAKQILQYMGKNIVYCGAVGNGQSAKICNNMLLGISMIGVSETMNLGIRLGLDPKLLAGILNSSSGRCWSSDTYNPVPGVMEGVPSSNDYKGGFGTALMAKDLGLAQNSSTKTLTPTPLGSLAHQLYRIISQKGYGTKDFSSIFQFLQDQNHEKK